MKRRIISLVLVFSLLAGATLRPQRANAVAVTATVVAASAAAILTACGVTYWAASQTDAINFIAGKIDDYLTSIEEPEVTYEEWLEIDGTSQLFEVVSGGVMRFTSGVANKLLDFCRWFQNDEEIESGGETIVDSPSLQVTAYTYSSGATVRGTISASIRGDIITIVMNNYLVARNDNVNINMLMPSSIADGDKVTVTATYNDVQGNGLLKWFLFTQEYADSYTFYGAPFYPNVGSSVDTTLSNGYRYLTLSISTAGEYHTGTIQARISADEPITSNVIITPSDFVNVPADIASASTFDVSPSVALSEGDSVEDAVQSILDGITSEDGLSSEVEETQETTWGWLYTLLVNIGEAITDGVSDIKQAVLGLADSIYNKFTTVLQDIKSGLSTLRQDVVSALGEVKQAVIGIPSKIDDAKQAILGLPSRIAEAVRGLFVPSADWADTYVSTLYNAFADRVGVLTYPLAVAESFLMRFLTVSVGDPVVSWPAVREPFSEQILIQAGSYNFNTLLENEQIARVHEILLVVVKAGMAFTLFELCRKKYNSIIHGGAS